jgi:tetratricopeptide (TPR) repeat protein
LTNIHTVLETQLSQRYGIVRELGHGGMASVFLAFDMKHHRELALKVLRPEVADAVGAERFLREIDTLAAMNHPHILPLHDSGQAGELLYFTMPFVEGESLRTRLERDGPLPVTEALRITLECADALAYAHGHGILHRDVKPANILLSNGHAVLADFGIARAVEESAQRPLTSAGIVLGTVGYMSPEQATGDRPVDARSDLYALGCVLYEMLTGEPPFAGRSRIAIIARQVAASPTAVSVLRPDVPPSVEQLVDRCLARTPADRFGSASELCEALIGVGSGPLGVPTGENRAYRRNWWRTAVSGLVMVGLASWLVVTVIAPSEGPPPDRSKVVVYPLANRGGGEHAGADVALMIGNALLHTDPLSWIDGWEHLEPSQRDDPAGVSSEEARTIASERGAGHYITGGIAGSGDSITVRLILHDTRGDSVVDQSSATGALSDVSPDQLGLQAVVQLLPSLMDPGHPVKLAPIADRNPAAVALWIQGDRAYRNARFGAALDFYERAVALDSLLTLAALKGAWAAIWRERPEYATDLVRLALRHDTVLPEPHRAFARGLLAFQKGDADAAVAGYGDALALDPEWPEAWTALGEAYRHLPVEGADQRGFGTSEFREAERLDSTFTPALVHLAESALVQGRFDRAGRLLARLRDAGAESDAYDWVVLMASCLAPGTTDPPPVAAPSSLIYASQQLAAGALHLNCAEAGFRAVLRREDLSRAEHWSAVMGFMGVLTVQNRVEALDSLLQESLASGEGSTRFLYALAVAAGVDLSDRATAVDAEAESMWGPDYRRTAPATLWLLALWNAMEGDLPVARTLVQRLDETAATSQEELTAVLAEAARAHMLAAAGDSTAALAVLRELTPSFSSDALDYGLVEPLVTERILLAELLLAVGDGEGAYRTAAVVDHPGAAIFVPFVARSLALRVRAAESLSGLDWARRAGAARSRLESLGRMELLQRP